MQLIHFTLVFILLVPSIRSQLRSKRQIIRRSTSKTRLDRRNNATGTTVTQFDYLLDEDNDQMWGLDGEFKYDIQLVGNIIKKTIFSKTNRVFFAAGLEGTGHHAFSTMLRHITCDVCSCSVNLSLALMNGIDGNGLFWTNDNRDIQDKLNIALHFMAQFIPGVSSINNRSSNSNSPDIGQLHVIGLDCVREAGMLSYPNYGHERFKVFDHPDVTVLASMAEHLKLDFRVLVLLRDASDVLVSTVDRRQFSNGNSVMQSKVLIINAAVLYTQLLVLDKQFYACVEYSELPAIDQSEGRSLKLLEFLHPELSLDTLRSMFTPVVFHDHFGNVSSSTDAHFQQLLERKMDMLRNMCSDRLL